MARDNAGNPMRAVLVLPALHVCLWAALGGWSIWYFGTEVQGFALHFAVMGAWLCCGILLSSAIAAAPRALGRGAAVASRLVALAASALLLAVYAMHAAANEFWGRDMNLHILVQYGSRLGDVVRIVSAEPAALPWVAGAAAAVAVLVLAFVRARPLSDGFRALGCALGGGRPGARAAAACVAGAVAAAGCGAAAVAWGAQPGSAYAGEPFTAFVAAGTHGGQMDAAARDSLADMAALQAYPPGAGNRRDVVMIFSDAMRGDRTSVHGYRRPTTPFLESLVGASGAQTVDMMLSPCPETVCGVLGLMSSKEVSDDYLRTLSLPALLKRLGYRINFVFSGEVRNYYELRAVFDRLGSDFQQDGSDCPDDPNDDECAVASLARMPPRGGTPSFTFVFLLSTHQVGTRHPGFDAFGRDPGEDARSPVYDARMLQVDHYMRRTVEGLRAKGYLDDALVVFSSDHGEALGEHGVHGHMVRVNQEFIRVPFVWWDTKGATSLAERRYAGSLDIAPTLLDALGLPTPPTWAGISLLRQPPAQRTLRHRTMLRRTTSNCSAVTGRDGDRLGAALRCENRPADEFYDLSADPGGLSPFPTDRGDPLLARLGRELGAYRAERAAAP